MLRRTESQLKTTGFPRIAFRGPQPARFLDLSLKLAGSGQQQAISGQPVLFSCS
jgi:hypothetical protein